jgi:hypothetical protein
MAETQRLYAEAMADMRKADEKFQAVNGASVASYENIASLAMDAAAKALADGDYRLAEMHNNTASKAMEAAAYHRGL